MKKLVSLLISITIILSMVASINVMANNEMVPQITSATLKQGSSSKVYTSNLLTHADSEIVTTGFVNPVVKDGGITDPSADGYYLYSNFSEYFKMFTGSDTQFYYYNIPEYMKDSTYFRLKKSWNGTRNDTGSPTQNPDSREAVVFTINHSADVYYIYQGTADSGVATNATWLNEDEWTKLDETVQYVNSSGVVANYLIYKKEYPVADGEEVTVAIGGQKGSYLPPQLFVDWKEEEKITYQISNETLKQGSSSRVYTVKLAERTDVEIVKDGYSEPIRKEDATTDVEDEKYYDVSNLDSYFKVLTDKDYYFHSIPEEIYDAQYFRLKSGWQGTKGDVGSPTQNPETTEALTFDINYTATVYYVYQSNTTSFIDTTAAWLVNDGWTLCDDMVEYIGGSGIHYDYHLFKKKFIVNPGETYNVKIGGFFNSNLPPMVFVDWLNEATTANVNVSVVGNGKVNKSGDQDVTIGEVFSIKATPDSGYVIDYIKFNGNDVVANAQGIYTTPEITENATIEVKFRAIEAVPEVTSSMLVFNYLDDETGLPCGITFATVGSSEDYNIKEYGIVFSKTDETPTIEETGTKFVAYSKSALGQFGVKLFGAGLKVGTEYYTTPYAIYESSVGEEIVYGTSTSFIPVDSKYNN